MPGEDRVAVGGSERAAPEHERVGPVDQGQRARVTLYLRDRAGEEREGLGRAASGEGAHLSREELAAAHGADPTDVEAVSRFAAGNGLDVVEVALGRRAVELEGTVGALAQAFGTELALYRHPEAGTYRGRSGALHLPAELAPVVTAVLGLDDRPQARAHFRVHASPAVSYTPVQVAELYDFPAGADGTGECVGIIELGGGYRASDLGAYFSQLGMAPPQVSSVGVDGGTSSPGSAGGPDGEVMLDIEVVGAAAPGAAIVVYFAPNSDRGFVDAVTTAVHDSVHRPSVVSISWGGPESSWTAQAMARMEQAFAEAAAMGVTVTVAAGDNGSTDGLTDGLQHVDFPASAPHALACGGTRLEGSGSRISAESVWNDGPGGGGATGGGISDAFPLPSYQTQASVPASANPGGKPGRGVPDVAGDADPQTGYVVRVDGTSMVIGGTSAVAPLWAALVARLNQALGKPLGFLQPVLYSAGARPGLHDIVTGTNGAYTAGPGWDPCTGLGSPDGATLLQALPGAGGTSGAP